MFQQWQRLNPMADEFPSRLPGENADADAWQAELRTFVHGRLERYQKAAESWLAILTTLLGLFGAVVVLNGGKAISDIRGGVGWRVAVLAAAAIVFALAFAAIFEGLHATWAGLSGGGRRTSTEGLWGLLHDQWSPPDLDVEHLEWGDFREYMQHRPDEIRARLHRSRIMGTLSAAMAGVLALLIVGNGALVKASTSVIVVEHGHVLCGPIHVGADGLSRIGGYVITGATQVMAGSC
jgi:hypothetical protein